MQAEAELAQASDTDLSDLTLPDLIPPAAPPAGWRTPPSLATRTVPSRPAPIPSDPAPIPSDFAPGELPELPEPPAQTAEDGGAS
ncbi:hypothetical protein [Streptomyces sp. NPDC001275]